ncbi:chemotaxis protein MotB [Pararobbsia alpina]|uniref:flagellar motor protein MotB n=1 Tax=Pararobbsia alpina TaxID=621374 RepID=UPI0039A52BDE
MPPPKKKEGGETDKVSLLILRRKSGHGDHGHHGGAWKIAYADFVTAMMAFFLLMWLLNSTNKSDKQGIADFFNRPISVAFDHGNSSSASASIINGGGTDLMSKTSAEVAHGDDSKTQNAVLVPNATTQKSADEQDSSTPGMMMPAADPMQPENTPRADTPDDAAKLKALKDRLDKMIEMNAKLQQFKNQIRIDITSEGLRIQIVDAQNRPMFQTGRAELEPYAKEILDQIGIALNDVPNHISIAGHTDSAPYSGALSGYSNWELSSERANSARRELGIGGLKELKVLQVRGLADALPLVKDDLAAPANRRISILVLNKKTEDAFYRDGGRMDLSTPGSAQPGDAQKPSGAAPAAGTPAQTVVSNHTSSPDGGSPNNVAASPEAVVARIKAAVDVADPAPHTNGGSGAAATAKAVPGAAQRAQSSANVAPSQAAVQPATPETGAKHGSPSQQDAATNGSAHASSVFAAIKTATAAAGASPQANAAGANGGTVAMQVASANVSNATGNGAGAASPQVQKISSGAITAPVQKVSAGAITPAPQKVSSGAIQPAATTPAPAAVEHNTSDFGRAQ